MPLFSIKQNDLERIKELPFKLERELQNAVERNLIKIFNLEFVQTEFALEGLRIDTLAFDQENKAFVIIEYKRDRNFSVIDQGYAYLALLLNHKADFILEYNEALNKNLRREDVDWSQSRVIFISPEFTKYQLGAINFRDLPIELWEVTKYENGTIFFNQIESPESNESIETISQKSETVTKVSKEIKVYSEEDHLAGMPDDIVNLYQEFRELVLSLGNIEIMPRKIYLGFKGESSFMDISIQKTKIRAWLKLKPGELDDPKGLARDVSNVGHWGSGDYEIILTPGEDLDYPLMLIKQAFKKHIGQ